MGNFQEASDLESSVSISPRRFEESPFIERTYCPGMIRGVYAGRYFPISLGEASRQVLEDNGCDVTWHTYPMPHSVAPEEIGRASCRERVCLYV